MSFRLPIEPDPMPLREAARALRHLVRRGSRTVRDTMGPGILPPPALAVADALMREAREAARGVETVVSGVARRVIGPTDPGALSLEDTDEARFGAATYAVLKAVLARLAVGGAFVSEAAARTAFASTEADRGALSAPDLAARLTFALIEARVIRGLAPGETGRVAKGSVETVAVFALMLWLQSARAEDDNDAALDAATDLALALAGETAAATTAGDIPRLSALYAKYAGHV